MMFDWFKRKKDGTLTSSNTSNSDEVRIKDFANFRELETAGKRVDVTTLYIGARLTSSLPTHILIKRLSAVLKNVKHVQHISVADDYTPNDEMSEVEAQFKAKFSSAQFRWTWEGQVDGKHGR